MLTCTRTATVTRRSVLAAAGVGAAALLAACGPGRQAPGPRATKGEATLVWSHWGHDTYGKFREDERIAIWEQRYPTSGIKIDHQPVSGNYMDKIVPQLAGGTGPDVFRLGWANVFPMLEQGQIVELDPLFKKHPQNWLARKDLKKWIVDGARYKGKLYGTPMGGDMSSIFINKTLFNNAQVRLPPESYKEPRYETEWTFDNVLDVARRLNKRPDQVGIDVSWGSGNPFSLVESWGGKTMSDNWDAFLMHEDPGPRAWQWLMDLRLTHKLTPVPEDAGYFSYVNGNLAMSWTLVSQMTYRTVDVKDKFDWDQLPWPHVAGKKPKVMFWYSAWSQNRNTRYPEEAFSWLHHVSGPEGVIPGVELGWELPLFRDLDPIYNKRIADWKKNVKPPLEGLDLAIQRHYYHQPRWGQAWRDHISPALNEIRDGKKPAAQALKEIKPAVDELLKEGAALMK